MLGDMARRRHCAWLSVLLGLLLPATAQAQLSVTFAARACPTYDSITANLARNDIQESLQDLGANTPYRSGQAIDPQIEASTQPRCRPLPNWRFTLGRGYQTRAVNGPWGSLSIVTHPFSDAIVPRASGPLLTAPGADTGRTLEGAVTVRLSAEQADLAARRNALWLEAG